MHNNYHYKLKMLTLALSVSLAGCVANSCQAYDTYTISASGRDMFTVYVFKEGEILNPATYLTNSPSLYTLDPSILRGSLEGLQYWANMLAPHAVNTSTGQVLLYTVSTQNASASNTSFNNGNWDYAENYLAKLLQENKQLIPIDPTGTTLPANGDSSLNKIEIGQNALTGTYGFAAAFDSVIPDTDGMLNITPVLIHELAHALGFACIDGYFGSFQKSASNPLSFTSHLVDINGTHAKEGMEIISEADFNTAKAADPTKKASDYFIINEIPDHDNYDTKGYAFFVGDHVSEVLNGTTYKGTHGLPVNGWEYGTAELSHVILPRILMSHNLYRSYNTFTEVELAVMQDMGYQLDRRNYFGYSVYGDGNTVTNTNGYWARNTAGTDYLKGQYNDTPLGIGLHIYGSNNTITQAADIMTSGTGAVGILVDGTGNTVNLAENVNVRVDGKNGSGLAVLYGKNNVINQYGTITALGDSGNGIRFDFGTNAASTKQYRGSYIMYKRTLPAKEYTSLYNDALVSDLEGPLASAYNLYGSLSGNMNALYITKNAFVDQINIHNGASLSGNITSEWKHFATTTGLFDAQPNIPAGNKNEPLALQYNGNTFAYTAYIPDLVTKLNFDADMAYNGNITGTDNMKLNVKGHTLSYTGKADVVNVQVDPGATLLGGTYTVNDMTTHMAPGFSDNTTGKFINNGTIGAITPANGDTSMSITGNLEQNGTIQFTANNKKLGYVDVSGTVTNASDARLQIDPLGTYRPSYAYTSNIIRQNGNSANLTYSQLTPYSTDLLTASYDAPSATITFTPRQTIDGGTDNQNQAFGAINSMYASGSETTQAALLGLYNGKSAATTRKALSEISGEDKNGAAMTMLLRTPVHNAVLARMHELHETYGHGGMGPGAKPALTSLDNEVWARLSKGWGELSNSEASYNTFDMTVGYDRAHGNYWRHGVLADYGTVTFAGNESHADTKDWRLGLYSTYENGQNHGLLYADYGWQNTDFYRSLPTLGLKASGKYDSHVVEVGAEYKRDLYPEGTRTWQISPYVDLQATHYKQDGYTEEDAGDLGQIVNDTNETYTAGTAGIELSRSYKDGGNLTFRAGYKKAFSGTNPKFQYRLKGSNSSDTYTTSTEQDRNFLILSMAAEKQITPQWSVKGDVGLERGSHDKHIDASVTVKYQF